MWQIKSKYFLISGLLLVLFAMFSAIPAQAFPPTDLAPTPTPIGGGTGKIAYLGHTKGDDGGYLVCVVDLTEEREQCLTDPKDSEGQNGIAWLPDGENLFITKEEQGKTKYYAINVNTGERKALSAATFDWSPDGKQIAYTVSEADGTSIFVANFDDSNPRKIGSGPFYGRYFGIELAWSPDGKEIAFNASIGDIEDVFVVNTDGSGEVVNLTNNGASSNRLFTISMLSWSPDGTQIAFTAFGTETKFVHLYIMNADGSNRFDAYPNTWFDIQTFEWSPDGSKYLFGAMFGNPFIVERKFDKVYKLEAGKVCSQSPTWSPDGNYILCITYTEADKSYGFTLIDVVTDTGKQIPLSGDNDPLYALWAPPKNSP